MIAMCRRAVVVYYPLISSLLFDNFSTTSARYLSQESKDITITKSLSEIPLFVYNLHPL
jgi:hypothetical protein